MGGVISLHGQDNIVRNRPHTHVEDWDVEGHTTQARKPPETCPRPETSQDTLDCILDATNRVEDDDISSVGMGTSPPGAHSPPTSRFCSADHAMLFLTVIGVLGLAGMLLALALTGQLRSEPSPSDD